jgi:hypothetical protein
VSFYIRYTYLKKNWCAFLTGDYRTPVPPPPPVVPPIAPSNQYGPGHLSNGRQIQTGAATASPRLNGQGRGDHYRTGNMVQTSLPGYPLSSNVPINHHPHHNTIGALSPPIYNAVPQHSPLPPPNTQYASRNEIFQYPTNSQPTRRLSNGSGGGTYGALPSNGTYLAQPSLHQVLGPREYKLFSFNLIFTLNNFS